MECVALFLFFVFHSINNGAFIRSSRLVFSSVGLIGRLRHVQCWHLHQGCGQHRSLPGDQYLQSVPFVTFSLCLKPCRMARDAGKRNPALCCALVLLAVLLSVLLSL